mmetsp:Transcript_12089/g.44857  ORF Transcript_12089/g.44857 Transcript_12089/m.44857 type:complete len:379 (+) Transcript_12089:216-1352(+)
MTLYRFSRFQIPLPQAAVFSRADDSIVRRLSGHLCRFVRPSASLVGIAILPRVGPDRLQLRGGQLERHHRIPMTRQGEHAGDLALGPLLQHAADVPDLDVAILAAADKHAQLVVNLQAGDAAGMAHERVRHPRHARVPDPNRAIQRGRYQAEARGKRVQPEDQIQACSGGAHGAFLVLPLVATGRDRRPEQLGHKRLVASQDGRAHAGARVGSVDAPDADGPVLKPGRDIRMGPLQRPQGTDTTRAAGTSPTPTARRLCFPPRRGIAVSARVRAQGGHAPTAWERPDANPAIVATAEAQARILGTGARDLVLLRYDGHAVQRSDRARVDLARPKGLDLHRTCLGLGVVVRRRKVFLARGSMLRAHGAQSLEEAPASSG